MSLRGAVALSSVLLLLLSAGSLLAGCADSDNKSSESKDFSGNQDDDLSPSHDDDNDDNNNDHADDDDDDDDDNNDDNDDNDDDNDDDDNDDNDDNDDDDNDDDDNDDNDDDIAPLVELIDGGAAVDLPQVMRLGADGRARIVTTRSRSLILYTDVGDHFAEEILAPYGGYPDMAIDAAGSVHIIYRRSDNSELTYLTDKSGAWVSEDLGAEVSAGLYSMMTVDAAGGAFFSYLGDGGELWYAENTAGTWQTHGGILPAGTYVVENCIGVDAGGFVHFAWVNQDGKPNYTTNRSGAWTTETLISGDNSQNSSLDLVVRQNGVAHLSFVHAFPVGKDWLAIVNYADNASGAWTVQPATHELGYYHTALAVDGDGFAHVLAGGYGSFAYLTNASGSWTKEDLDGSWSFDLEVDAAGTVHVSNQGQLLRYAVKPAGGDWAWRDVAADGVAGPDSALAIDAAGNVHVVYYFATDRSLRHATNAGGAWTHETIDAGPRVGVFPSADFDAAGVLHVAYCDDAGNGMKHAANPGGVWETEIVDPEVTSPGWTSLKVGPDGAVHIAYHEIIASFYAGHLKHAVWREGEWEIEIVELAPNWETNYATYVSMAIDADNRTQLVYDYELGETDDDTDLAEKYAVNAGGGWEISRISVIGQEAVYTALALDSAQAPNLLYGLYGELFIVRRWGGGWLQRRILETPLDIRWYALAIDAGDRGHVVAQVSYYNIPPAPDHGLVYLAQHGWLWRPTVIDWVGADIGERPALALDDQGRAHVVYYGVNALWHASFAVD